MNTKEVIEDKIAEGIINGVINKNEKNVILSDGENIIFRRIEEFSKV